MGRQLIVNLVSRDNGVGLTTDLDLLEQLLTGAGHQVQRVEWTARAMRRCDVAVFIELLNPRLIRYARSAVGVFNLEWFQVRWRPYLGRFSQLWAKSCEAQEVYSSWRLPSTLTGFLSRDLHDPQVPRALECFHLRGHSTLKGTGEVLEAWRRHPDLPPLTVVSSVPLQDPPPGVTVLPRLPHEELVRRMNAAQIHLCPSKTEGWGHYITEGMSVGAAVVTTDASPMNEHVQPGRGIVVPAARGDRRHMVYEHVVDPDDLAAAVRTAAAMSEQTRRAMGERARAYVTETNQRFHQTVLGLLAGL